MPIRSIYIKVKDDFTKFAANIVSSWSSQPNLNPVPPTANKWRVPYFDDKPWYKFNYQSALSEMRVFPSRPPATVIPAMEVPIIPPPVTTYKIWDYQLLPPVLPKPVVRFIDDPITYKLNYQSALSEPLALPPKLPRPVVRLVDDPILSSINSAFWDSITVPRVVPRPTVTLTDQVFITPPVAVFPPIFDMRQVIPRAGITIFQPQVEFLQFALSPPPPVGTGDELNKVRVGIVAGARISDGNASIGGEF